MSVFSEPSGNIRHAPYSFPSSNREGDLVSLFSTGHATQTCTLIITRVISKCCCVAARFFVIVRSSPIHGRLRLLNQGLRGLFKLCVLRIHRHRVADGLLRQVHREPQLAYFEHGWTTRPNAGYLHVCQRRGGLRLRDPENPPTTRKTPPAHPRRVAGRRRSTPNPKPFVWTPLEPRT